MWYQEIICPLRVADYILVLYAILDISTWNLLKKREQDDFKFIELIIHSDRIRLWRHSGVCFHRDTSPLNLTQEREKNLILYAIRDTCPINLTQERGNNLILGAIRDTVIKKWRYKEGTFWLQVLYVTLNVTTTIWKAIYTKSTDEACEPPQDGSNYLSPPA